MTCKRAVFYLHGVASPQSTNRRPENVEVSALLSVADVFHYDARNRDRRATNIRQQRQHVPHIAKRAKVGNTKIRKDITGEKRIFPHDPFLTLEVPGFPPHHRAVDGDPILFEFERGLLLLPCPRPYNVPVTHPNALICDLPKHIKSLRFLHYSEGEHGTRQSGIQQVLARSARRGRMQCRYSTAHPHARCR